MRRAAEASTRQLRLRARCGDSLSWLARGTCARGASGTAAEQSFDAARAARELQLAKLSQAHELELAKLQLARELELAKLQLAREQAQQGRGLWEVVLGIKRETAQLLNLAGGGALFLASAVYLTSSMVHESRSKLHDAWTVAQDARHDVRALIANAHGARPRTRPPPAFSCCP